MASANGVGKGGFMQQITDATSINAINNYSLEQRSAANNTQGSNFNQALGEQVKEQAAGGTRSDLTVQSDLQRDPFLPEPIRFKPIEPHGFLFPGDSEA
jgi:hypothetical protein